MQLKKDESIIEETKIYIQRADEIELGLIAPEISLYITNKALIFEPQNKEVNIPFSKIMLCKLINPPAIFSDSEKVIELKYLTEKGKTAHIIFYASYKLSIFSISRTFEKITKDTIELYNMLNNVLNRTKIE